MFEKLLRLADLTEQLNAVRPISAELLKHDPQDAAAQLVTVLEEVSGMFTSFELTIKRYVSMLPSAANRDQLHADLVELEGAEFRKMVGAFRAHCSNIEIIYLHYLREWFDDAPLSREEKEKLESLFLKLADSDLGVIIPAVEELAAWLKNQVAIMTDLVDNEQYDEAKRHIKAARAEIQPVREKMHALTGEFLDLEIQFTTRPRGPQSSTKD